MDLSQVRYFNAVARHGSFSAAAKALGITQPGLTKAVRRLEASLDCALFVRLPRGVALTQQGRRCCGMPACSTSSLQDARKEVRALAGGAVGELRIGAGPSWLSRALPRIVAGLTARISGAEFPAWSAATTARLMEALSSGDLDLVVSALPDHIPAGLRAIPLTTDTISVVARDSHPLRAKRRPQPSSTLAYPWVLPGRDVLSALAARRAVSRRRARAAARQDRIRFDLVHRRRAARQRHAVVCDLADRAQRDGRHHAAANPGPDHDPVRRHPFRSTPGSRRRRARSSRRSRRWRRSSAPTENVTDILDPDPGHHFSDVAQLVLVSAAQNAASFSEGRRRQLPAIGMAPPCRQRRQPNQTPAWTAPQSISLLRCLVISPSERC